MSGRPLPAPVTELWSIQDRKQLATRLAKVALGAAWSMRHPRERFVVQPGREAVDPLYYQSLDGWEAPLWRHPPKVGAAGEPILLAHGLATSGRSFDLLGERSLVGALHDAGYDVYLLEHRGDPHAIAPDDAGHFDFDDIVAMDVPAAIDAIRESTGAARVLWLGHAMGGLLAYAHLARGGGPDLAGLISMCAPVRFDAPRTQTRVAAVALGLLPAGWAVPLRAVQRVLAPTTTTERLSGLARDVEGPVARGLMLHAGNDVAAGLVRQVARWVASGALCDRHDRLDYVAALAGARTPTLVVAAEGDAVCPPAAARPAFDAIAPASRSWLKLDGSWGHLDPLVGRRAPEELHTELLAWLADRRARCW